MEILVGLPNPILLNEISNIEFQLVPTFCVAYKPGAHGSEILIAKCLDAERPVAAKDIYVPSESKLAKSHYVPFGKEFILHPKSVRVGSNTGMDTIAVKQGCLCYR